MADSVLVTVWLKNTSFSADMELPSNMQIKALKRQLLKALKEIAPETFNSIEKIELWEADKKLNEESSLTNSCIWDGSYLTITAEV